MTQKHVDLLMEAVNLEHEDYFLCNRIEFITGIYLTHPNLIDNSYTKEEGGALTSMIQKNIDSNFFSSEFKAGCGNTYSTTTFSQAGMTRKEWAETILAPLALELPEDN